LVAEAAIQAIAVVVPRDSEVAVVAMGFEVSVVVAAGAVEVAVGRHSWMGKACKATIHMECKHKDSRLVDHSGCLLVAAEEAVAVVVVAGVVVAVVVVAGVVVAGVVVAVVALVLADHFQDNQDMNHYHHILEVLDYLVASLCRKFQETIRMGERNDWLGSRKVSYMRKAFQLPSNLFPISVDKSSRNLDLYGDGGNGGLLQCYSPVVHKKDLVLVEGN
jgi:hypothetical protein